MPDLAEGVDYCTSWPDFVWGIDLRPCCAAHDLAYGTAGFFGSFQADVEFGVCIASAAGWGMGALMFAGVATFGTAIKIGIANRFRPGQSDGQGR